MKKHFLKIYVTIIICCLFVHFELYAQPKDDVIVLTNDTQPTLISPHFAVYKDDKRALSFEEFVRARNFLPYRKFIQANYGFQEHGVWLYAKINNQSDTKTWFMSARYSQLQEARLYLRHNGQLIYQSTDGIQNKSSPYALPAFNITLEKNKTVEAYIFLRASSISLLAPIYIQDSEAFTALTLVDYSIWGVLNGIVALLALFALSLLIYTRNILSGVFIAHLVTLVVFQLLWSGHAVHLPYWVTQIFVYLRAESILLLSAITSTVVTLSVTPLQYQKANVRTYLITNSIFAFIFALVFLSTIVAAEIKIFIAYSIAFGGIFANFLLSIIAYRKGFFPAIPLAIGWGITLMGSIISAFFIFSLFPNHLYHRHFLYLSLVIQAITFMLSVVLKKQYDLQLEVDEAQSDAQINYKVIEEQNVHLDIARKLAEKASDVKSQFLANMSHEIRTPLSAIIGFSKELENKEYMVERDEHVRIINNAASDLLTLVNDVLDFSKMEAGKLTLNNRPFSPRDLLEDVAALMSKSAHLKQLEFIFDVKELPTSLVGDAFKIKQLLSNLLSNALKFTNFGYISVKTLIIEQDDKHCIIEFQIEDTGIGISTTDIKKLFTAFHQLDDELNRSFQGTGLGLVICQELVSLMGGEISVSSTPGKGSLFVTKIPFVIDHSAINLRPINRFTGHKAILVDAWSLSRNTTEQQLRLAGFEVDTYAHLDDIEKLSLSDEYVMVAIPNQNTEIRHLLLEKLSCINIHNLVLLYSGPVPNIQPFHRNTRKPTLLRLPLSTRKISDIDKHVQRSSGNINESLMKSLPQIRILAVDDMELNLLLLQTWMKGADLTLDLAHSGDEAIAMCKQYDYDIILMDIQMPHMDGLTATRHIRKTEMNIGTPIVAVTAHALESEKQHFLDSGMDDFLSKPIDLLALIDIINNWCESYQRPDSHLEDTAYHALSQSLVLSIDWELMLKRAHHDKAAAISFFEQFVNELPLHAEEIESAWQAQRKDTLLASIHKLHGVCCYTGVPKLHHLCEDVEERLKSEELTAHSITISSLLIEIEHVASQWPLLRENVR